MNINSAFDILRGLPPEGMANVTVATATGAALPTGTIVAFITRQLAAAKVLKMINDTLTTAPTLNASDRGKAYVVAGTGGAWSSFSEGDIVEWDGTEWNLVVENSSGAPPAGTRVIVGSNPGGSFQNHTDKVMVYSSGAWNVANEPVNRNHIKIDGAGSVFYNMFFDYSGTYPNGFWYKALSQKDVPAVVAPATSGGTNAAAPMFGIVTRGYDNFDSQFLDKVTVIPLHAGALFKATSADAGMLVPGNLLSASSGAIIKCPNNTTRPIGIVVRANATTNEVVFISM